MFLQCILPLVLDVLVVGGMEIDAPHADEILCLGVNWKTYKCAIKILWVHPV